MTNKNQECTCSKFSDLIIDTNGCKVHYLSPSQPSSVPVEECFCKGGMTCDNAGIIHSKDVCFTNEPKGRGNVSLSSPSTPEVSWEWQRKFLENGTYETGTDLSCMIPTVSEIITYQERTAILTERKRVNDILDGMKKEEKATYSHYCECDGECFSECSKSYNVALEQAKHLINNTQ